MKPYTKKIMSLVLVLLFTVTLINTKVNAEYYRFEIIDQTFRVHEGTTTEEKYGNLTFADKTELQRMNFMDFDLSDDNMHLVTISNYNKNGWGMFPLEVMMNQFEADNPHVEVLGGINGSGYAINTTGSPNGIYVEDYEVVSGQTRDVVFIIKEDGSVEIGPSKVDGYEVIVKDQNNEIKFRKPININKELKSSDEVGAFFRTYDKEIPKDLNPLLIEGTDVKYINNRVKLTKGIPSFEEIAKELSREEFVIVNKEITDSLTEFDKIIIQDRLIGFDDVRGALTSFREKLVDKGKPIEDEDASKHPRTAIGIRKDGSVFFMVNDGRDEINGIKGLTMKELSRVMIDHGAYDAVNLDGGGSSTMIVRNPQGEFETINKLSDGRMRSISNGILVVRGDISERPLHIRGEDTRKVFDSPSNLYIDSNNTLKFTGVKDATRYIVKIGEQLNEITGTEFNLNHLSPGEHTIEVRAKGNYDGKASVDNYSITTYINKRPIQDMIDW